MTESVQAVPAPSAVPVVGGLRLDGGAVEVPVVAGPLGWRASAVIAASAIRAQPGLIGPGLLGFLSRGGLVLFLVPILVLPTPAGIGTFIGGTALTGAGATDSLIRLVVAIAISALIGMIAGLVGGSVSDVLLMRAAASARIERQHGDDPVAADEEALRRVPLDAAIVARLTVVRLISILPLAILGGYGAARLGSAIYHQLILPEDLDVPLAFRALREAADGVAAAIVGWLISDWIGALATRWLLAEDGWLLAAFPHSCRLLVRRPLTSLATFLLPTLLLIVAAVPILFASAALWSDVQALLADTNVVLALPLTMAFVAVWGGGLLLIGVIASWRGVFGALDTLRALPDDRPRRQRTA
jgi:hypothetical protein